MMGRVGSAHGDMQSLHLNAVVNHDFRTLGVRPKHGELRHLDPTIITPICAFIVSVASVSGGPPQTTQRKNTQSTTNKTNMQDPSGVHLVWSLWWLQLPKRDWQPGVSRYYLNVEICIAMGLIFASVFIPLLSILILLLCYAHGASFVLFWLRP